MKKLIPVALMSLALLGFSAPSQASGMKWYCVSTSCSQMHYWGYYSYHLDKAKMMALQMCTTSNMVLFPDKCHITKCYQGE
ncbi:MAG: hypothetical protein AB7F64_06745 [Gammaproteobacteria bacterium]